MDDPRFAQYVDTLESGCPILARSFKHVCDLRLGTDPYVDNYVDFGLADDGVDKRVNKAINAQKRVTVPTSWTPLVQPNATLAKYTGATCQTHRCIQALLPDLAWYDPEHPQRGGWVLSGSAARPCMRHECYPVEVNDIRPSAMGIDEHVATIQNFYMPHDSNDIDLFLVVGGDDDSMREMVGRVHIENVMKPGRGNPMIKVSHNSCPGICQKCSKVKYDVHGVCADCPGLNGRKRRGMKLYDYVNEHVVGYKLRGFDIQFVTRVYKHVDLIVPRFDMTIDGAVFSPKMGLRVLPLALQEWRNGIVLLTPFSGSRTMLQRVHKKTVRYGVVPVIPGYVEDLDAKDLVYALSVARVMSAIDERCMKHRILAKRRTAFNMFRMLPKQYRMSAMTLWHPSAHVSTILKRIDYLNRIETALLDDSTKGQSGLDRIGHMSGDGFCVYQAATQYVFSSSPDCLEYAVPDTPVIILIDKSDTKGSSGSFQALTVAETLDVLGVPEAPAPGQAAPEAPGQERIDVSLEAPSPEHEAPEAPEAPGPEAAISIHQDAMDPALTKTSRRALAAFTTQCHQSIINNAIVNRGIMVASEDLCYVLIGSGTQPGVMNIALNGHFGFGVNGSQIWQILVDRLDVPAVIRCMTATGIYEIDTPVCMGSQTHFHQHEAVQDGIAFSLPALVMSLIQRPGLILEGDIDHVSSVGVLKTIENVDTVAAHHLAAMSEVEEYDWVYKLFV